MHADAEHITMNLIFIWVFGSLVLSELGAVWFFSTFVLAAITGGIIGGAFLGLSFIPRPKHAK